MNELVKKIIENCPNPKAGLPEEVFLMMTQLTPMVNVDLLVKDEEKGILLSWRRDRFYEQGWHVPGGIIRIKETFEERLQKVGEMELGCKNIEYNPEPIEVVPIICNDMTERGHFISFVYDCKLPKGYEIKNRVKEGEAGYLKWFKSCPDNILQVHEFYRKYWDITG